MEFSINYHKDIFMIKLTQKADPQKYEELFNVLTSHDKWVPGSVILSDETELKVGHLTIKEVETIADISGRWRKKLGAAMFATIVRGDLNFGMNRMWDAYVAHQWDVTHKVFRSEPKGLDWLSKRRL